MIDSVIKSRSFSINRRSAFPIFFTSPFSNQPHRNPIFIPSRCSHMEFKGIEDVAQNGNSQIQVKKSPVKLSTTEFEAETIALGLDFVTHKIANASLHDSDGKASDKIGSVVILKSKHTRGASSLDENDFQREIRVPSSLPDGSPRVNAAVLRSPNPGRTPTRVTGKGTPVTASPFWERKVSTLGNNGGSSSTPGRRQARAIILGEESPDNSPTVPKFGDWDESNPAASEGFTKVFDQVREQKQNGGGNRTPSTNGTSSQRRQTTFKSSEGCCCFRWAKR